MLTEKEIRQKWREICTRNRPPGCAVDSGAFAIELVRWVESGLTPVAADALCDCYISVPAGNYPDLCAHCSKKARR